MQNVSQALIIAGSVILGVILLATLVNVLKMGGSVNKAYDEKQLNYQTEAFNYQYEIYQKDDNTVMDMVTLLNLAYSANSENNYDLNSSVTIIIKIGDLTYRIPKDVSTNAETFFNNNVGALERNQVYEVRANKVISVYDLLNKTLKELNNLSFGTSSDKLSKVHIGEYIYYPDRKTNDPDYGKPVLGNNGTTYKYVFDCDDSSITYNKTTGRISKMEFVCKENPYWELGSYYSLRTDNLKPEWD